jgi:hypothetical protein
MGPGPVQRRDLNFFFGASMTAPYLVLGFSTGAMIFTTGLPLPHFTLLRFDRLTEIIVAATPTPGSWFRSSRDTFREVLRDAGHELETFAWSEWVLNTLDLYLENRHGFMYSNFGDAAASRQLSKARGSDWLFIPASSAIELLVAVDRIECEASDVTAFVASEDGPDSAAEEAAAVQAALTALKAWLAQLSPGSVGLLSIG